jgi:hypothetical protein
MKMPTNKWEVTLPARSEFEYDCATNGPGIEQRIEVRLTLRSEPPYPESPTGKPTLGNRSVTIGFGCSSERFMGTSLPSYGKLSYGRKALIFWVPGY